jgi:hypothetical protein
MNSPSIRAIAAACALACLSGCGSDSISISDVAVRYSATDPNAAIFPSNRYSVADAGQNTMIRVAMPKPDCTVQVSDCYDFDVTNTLDGFSTQPRIAIPFSGDIDPASINSNTVYLINVGDARTGAGRGGRVGINQITWDKLERTLYVESDELLAEHSRYLLVVTDGVRDTQGRSLSYGAWQDPTTGLPIGNEPSGAYRTALVDAASLVPQGSRPIALSLFTTQSATTDLVKIQKTVRQSAPAPIDFMIATQGTSTVRAVFDRTELSSIQFSRHATTASTFTNSNLALPALELRPGAVAKVAYGRYKSPRYINANIVIPATPTFSGTPQAQGTDDVIVQMFIPAGTQPAGGWPVAIFGHGFGDSMYGGPWNIVSTLAAKGIAVAMINVVGHGGGPLSTLTVNKTNGAAPISLPAGGRSIDLNGNGAYEATEGSTALIPYAMISARDGLRQTVIDLMQLVREIQTGVDVDGDGAKDLDANRIYYAGQSFGGIYGTMFTAVEPGVKAGVLNVPGGSLTEVTRLGSFRSSRVTELANRRPSLINLQPDPAAPTVQRFNENMPLRNQPVLVNDVPGAMAIARVFDRSEWVMQSSNPVSYAYLLRKQPLDGAAPKPVIYQFALGDSTVPNPGTSAIIRAGGLENRTTLFRNDLAYAQNPAVGKNPHSFLLSASAAALPYALAAQEQIATFFADGGNTMIDPDGAQPFFEMPLNGPLPEGLNYIP